MPDAQHILAFDIGGTKITGAVFDLEGKRLTELHSLPTMASKSPTFTLMNLKRVGVEATRKAGFEGPPAAVGMGCPGPLDLDQGRFGELDRIPRLSGFNMKGFVEQEFGAELFLGNDAACFILGEARQGAAQGCSSAVGLSLGSHCGCGIILNSELYLGSTNSAGAVGPCALAESDFNGRLSGPGLRQIYREVTDQDPPSARELAAQARGGDEMALESWRRFGDALGSGLGTLCAVLDPDVAVLGGAVAQHMLLFRGAMRESMEPAMGSRQVRVAASALGSAAAVVGAAEYARERVNPDA